jgi:hypothetical protein
LGVPHHVFVLAVALVDLERGDDPGFGFLGLMVGLIGAHRLLFWIYRMIWISGSARAK